MLELYHNWSSFCSIKVRLCLAEKNLPWESRFVDLMNLDQLPTHGFKLAVFPVKWIGTTAAPVRAVAILED